MTAGARRESSKMKIVYANGRFSGPWKIGEAAKSLRIAFHQTQMFINVININRLVYYFTTQIATVFFFFSKIGDLSKFSRIESHTSSFFANCDPRGAAVIFVCKFS